MDFIVGAKDDGRWLMRHAKLQS